MSTNTMNLPSKFARLRALAEKLISDEWREIDLENFNDEANPQTVLALLDLAESAMSETTTAPLTEEELNAVVSTIERWDEAPRCVLRDNTKRLLAELRRLQRNIDFLHSNSTINNLRDKLADKEQRILDLEKENGLLYVQINERNRNFIKKVADLILEVASLRMKNEELEQQIEKVKNNAISLWGIFKNCHKHKLEIELEDFNKFCLKEKALGCNRCLSDLIGERDQMILALIGEAVNDAKEGTANQIRQRERDRCAVIVGRCSCPCTEGILKEIMEDK